MKAEVILSQRRRQFNIWIKTIEMTLKAMAVLPFPHRRP
jgi:hypothetical protein